MNQKLIEKITSLNSFAFYNADEFAQKAFVDKSVDVVVSSINSQNIEKVAKNILKIFGNVDLTILTPDCINLASDWAGTTSDNLTRFFAENVELGDYIKTENVDIFVQKQNLISKTRFDFNDLVEIMRKLRDPIAGCEWDKAQDHDTIKINLIEECYELIDAIDQRDLGAMQEELGDVLLQSVFHSQIAEDTDEFCLGDVLTTLSHKLVTRHTHIFGENHAENKEQALLFWQEAKKKEKKYKSVSDSIERVPKNLPALLYAEKIQKLAKKSGFDWDDISGALAKIDEEKTELIEADKSHQFEEAGDLLFAVVNVLRFLKIDPEMALMQANRKFARRFFAVEQLAIERQIDMKASSIEELDLLWEEVKRQEKSEE